MRARRRDGRIPAVAKVRKLKSSSDLQPQVLNLFLACLILTLMSARVSFGQKVKVGQPAPDFSVPTLDDGKTVRLSDFRGRRVLIFTWASW